MSDLDLRDVTTGNMIVAKGQNDALFTKNDSFRPSSYTSRQTMDGVGVAIPLSSDARNISLTNLDATDFAVCAFGTSSANAIVNLSVATAIGNTGEVLLPLVNLVLGVPALATHIALITGVNAATPIVNITQGV